MDLKKVKTICILMLAFFMMLMLMMCITINPVWGYVAIGWLGVYGIFITLAWKCPRCKKNLGPLWVKHCSNCGEKIF